MSNGARVIQWYCSGCFWAESWNWLDFDRSELVSGTFFRNVEDHQCPTYESGREDEADPLIITTNMSTRGSFPTPSRWHPIKRRRARKEETVRARFTENLLSAYRGYSLGIKRESDQS